MTFPLQKFVIDLLCPAGSVGHFKACVRYLLPSKPFWFLLKLFQAGPDKIGKALQRCAVESPTCLSVSHTPSLLQRQWTDPFPGGPHSSLFLLAPCIQHVCMYFLWIIVSSHPDNQVHSIKLFTDPQAVKIYITQSVPCSVFWIWFRIVTSPECHWSSKM